MFLDSLTSSGNELGPGSGAFGSRGIKSIASSLDSQMSKWNERSKVKMGTSFGSPLPHLFFPI